MKNKWPVLAWLILIAIASVIIARARFTADFSAFLPIAPTPEQKILVDQLQNGVVARMLLIGIEGGDSAQRAQISKHLAARLHADAAFIAVNNGEPLALQRDQQFLLENRYLLSPAIDAQRFSAQGLQTAIEDTLASLASPAGLALKHFIGRDPTGEFLQLLEQINSSKAPAMQAGVWVSASGERALLFVQTSAEGSDTDGQQVALAHIRSAFLLSKTDLTAEANATGQSESGAAINSLQLEITGPGAFAVSARDTIRTQAERLAALSLIFVVIFLWFIYRSWHLLLLGLLPVATAIVAGIAATALYFGSVHGITLGFGSTLVGEAVDYAIYFFVQAQGASFAQWRRNFWPTIRLGVFISICGFATLLFSGFAGLAQLGLYSIAGLIAAALTARFVLPCITPLPLQIAPALRLGEFFQRLLARRSANGRFILIGLAIVAAAIVYAQREQLWNDSLSALSPISAAETALDNELRADIGAPDVRYIVALAADSEEEALQRTERAADILQASIADGAIAGFETPSRYLPSRARQQMRQQVLPDTQTLQRNLAAALEKQPLRADKLTEFVRDIDSAKKRALLTRNDLRGSSFALAVDSLLRKNGSRWEALLPLQALPDHEIPAAAIRAQLQTLGSEVWLLDITGETAAMYTNYFREAMHLSEFGLLAIVCVLAIHLRSAAALIAVIAPLFIAVLCVMAALALAHERLHLLHLIGLFLIVAVGSNYALFFAKQKQMLAQTLASLLIANITTVAGFGLLALSSVPVLHAIGITVAPGAVLSLIFSAWWSRANEKSMEPIS